MPTREDNFKILVMKEDKIIFFKEGLTYAKCLSIMDEMEARDNTYYVEITRIEKTVKE